MCNRSPVRQSTAHAFICNCCRAREIYITLRGSASYVCVRVRVGVRSVGNMSNRGDAADAVCCVVVRLGDLCRGVADFITPKCRRVRTLAG